MLLIQSKFEMYDKDSSGDIDTYEISDLFRAVGMHSVLTFLYYKPQQLVYYNVSPLRGSIWVTRIGCCCFAAGSSQVHTH